MANEKQARSILLAAALVAALLDPDKLKKVAQDAIDAVAEQEKSLDDAAVFITELEEQLEKQKRDDVNYRPEVKLKTGTFRIVHGVNLGDPKGVLEPEAIAADQKLVQSLYDAGSSAVVKIA